MESEHVLQIALVTIGTLGLLIFHMVLDQVKRLVAHVDTIVAEHATLVERTKNLERKVEMIDLKPGNLCPYLKAR